MQKVKSILQQDVTHHTILTLAAFGLIVSSVITTLGVATLGVQAQVAFAQNETVRQTAAALMGDNRGSQPTIILTATVGASTTPERPSMQPAKEVRMASSTMATGMFCPTIARTLMRGNSDATSTGEVAQLQKFIANKYGLNEKDVVTGYFGSTTAGYLQKFQQEQGIAPAPQVGPLTRAAIAKLCAPKQERDQMMGSSTPQMGSTSKMMQRGDRPEGKGEGMGSTTRMMGSTTEPRREHPTPPMPPKATSTPTTVSYKNNSSNAASVIEALNEIGTGYTKLFSAALSSIGL